MTRNTLTLAVSAALTLSLLGCSSDDNSTSGGTSAATAAPAAPAVEATPANITLDLIGRHASGEFLKSAAEITAYDAASKRAFVVNALSGSVDVLDLSNPAAPAKIGSISAASIEAGASINSVAVHDGLVAVAIQAADKTDNGYVALYKASDLSKIAHVDVGALPDMLTFTPDGRTILVANEGEPSDDYRIDPNGSVSVITLANPGTPLVRTARFTAFNGQEAALRAQGIRLYGPGANAARDLEPEYIAVAADSKTAWVTLQENNALAIVDIGTATVTSIKALGFKDYGLADSGFANAHGAGNSGNGIDSADEGETVAGHVGGKAVNIVTKTSVRGMYLPDSIASHSVGSTTYLVTANEGDARAWGETDNAYWGSQTISNANSLTTLCTGGDASKGFVEEFRVKHLTDARGYNRRCGDDLPPQLAAMAGGAFLNPANFGWCGASDAGTNTQANPRGSCGDDGVLGRLNISWTMGYQTHGSGAPKLFDRATGAALPEGTTPTATTWLKYDHLYSYGARSFSIWGADGSLVWDSGDAIEKFLASDDCKLKADRSLACKTYFNSAHDKGNAFDDRSDAKGPEPEGLAIGKIGDKTFAFVGLERMGGILVYDITTPTAPKFQDYLNTREEWVTAPSAGNLSGYGDLGPEGLHFVPAGKSPSGKPLLIVGNEVSGTTAVYEIRQTF